MPEPAGNSPSQPGFFASVIGMQQLAEADAALEALSARLASGKVKTSYHCGGCGKRLYPTMSTSRTEWGHVKGDWTGPCDPPHIGDGKFGPVIVERRWIVVADGERPCNLNNYGGVWTREEFA